MFEHVWVNVPRAYATVTLQLHQLGSNRLCSSSSSSSKSCKGSDVFTTCVCYGLGGGGGRACCNELELQQHMTAQQPLSPTPHLR
jgi:hypothetical protein